MRRMVVIVVILAVSALAFTAFTATAFIERDEGKQIAEALTAYFEGKELEAEKMLERLNGTSTNPVVPYTLSLMNLLRKNVNYPKNVKLSMKIEKLKDRNNETYSDIRPIVEYYAEQKVPAAQIFLADMYQSGKGVEKDNIEAKKLFSEHADNGNAYAQKSMGDVCSAMEEYQEALAWYMKAAEQGYAPAQFSVGNMYSFGRGTAQDNSKALEWYMKAAEQGYATAQFFIGNRYQHMDDNKALEWYMKAAEQGHAVAQFFVGNMYYDGMYYNTRIVRNEQIAYMWWYLSKLSGAYGFDDKLKDLEQTLSLSDIEEAKRLAEKKFSEIQNRQ